MTEEGLKKVIIDFIKNSKYKIAYFTVNASASGVKEVISFHEEEKNGIGGVLPEMLTLSIPDTLLLAELVQRLKPVREYNGAFTYPISELGL